MLLFISHLLILLFFINCKKDIIIINHLKNGDFNDGFKNWEIKNYKFNDFITDFKKPQITTAPSLVNKLYTSNEIDDHKSILFEFVNRIVGQREGLVQSIITEDIKLVRSPLVLSFSHIIKGIQQSHEGILMYVNIRYQDGSFLPIYNKPKVVLNHESWETDSVIIPYIKPIENIVVGFGVHDVNPVDGAKFKILFDNLNVLSFKHGNGDGRDINLKDILTIVKKSTRYHIINRTPQNLRVELNSFKSYYNPVFI